MSSKLTVYNSKGELIGRIRKAYLVKFVDPKKMYPVDHHFSSGERVNTPTTLVGADLTENQIVSIFLK